LLKYPAPNPRLLRWRAAVGCAAACGAEAQQIAGVGGLHGAVELADAAVIAVRPAAEPIAQPGGREGRTIRCI
jgi:hypothetical protein